MVMNHANFPSNIRPVFDSKGEIISDKNKKVIINSIGGALVNATGVVAEGPFTWDIVWEIENEINGKKEMKTFEAGPYWLVQLDSNGFYLKFVKNEMIFM